MSIQELPKQSNTEIPKLVFDNTDCFVDITTDAVRIKFADTEIIDGHTFRHIEYGIFAAEPAFEISTHDMQDMKVNYEDVVYAVECKDEATDSDKQIYKVIFAYSKAICNSFYKLNYINSQADKNSKLKEYYDFNQHLQPIEYNYYSQAQLTYDNLYEKSYALLPIYNQIVLPDARRPWIKLNNHIGIEVEDGIYYFATSGDSIGTACTINLPVIDLNSTFDNEVAAICHPIDFHLSFNTAIKYLALGKEHFKRLNEIQQVLKSGNYHEFKLRNAPVKPDAKPVPQAVINKTELPSNAEELIKGLGFFKLTVRFERPFFEPTGFSEYDIAYKSGEMLVLGTQNNNELVYEYHNLRFLSALYVKHNTRLNSGIDYPVIHTVLDCRDTRLKELLTPEAYKLYLNELNSTQ